MIGACAAESWTWLPDKSKVQKDVEARDAIRKQKVRGTRNFRAVVEREDVRLATWQGVLTEIYFDDH